MDENERLLSDLVAYENNPRTHSDEQVVKIAIAMERFGFTAPILIDRSNRILAGHGRALAAEKLGLKVVPVRVVGDDWSEADRAAYTIWDNQSALLSGWDYATLKAEVTRLKIDDYKLDVLGFDRLELTQIMNSTEGNAEPERAPDPPANPVTKPGDIWILGRHRIACGDSTSPETVARILAGAKPHLMVTDPPYGVKYDPTWSDGGITSHRFVNARARGAVENDEIADWSPAWRLFGGDVAYVWHADKFAPDVASNLRSAGFLLRSQIIWAKTRHVISRGNYHYQHEPCWYAVRKGAIGHWSGDRTQTTLWSIEHQKSETGHGTQKPIECMKRPIENNSAPGDHVYDPFVGSGTTIIAAEMTARNAIAVELSPAYVDVCVQRWQEFTGESAVREPAR